MPPKRDVLRMAFWVSPSPNQNLGPLELLEETQGGQFLQKLIASNQASDTTLGLRQWS